MGIGELNNFPANEYVHIGSSGSDKSANGEWREGGRTEGEEWGNQPLLSHINSLVCENRRSWVQGGRISFQVTL